MVNFADTAIGNFTAAIKAKDMWDEMIIVFSADNGTISYQDRLGTRKRKKRFGKNDFQNKRDDYPSQAALCT